MQIGGRRRLENRAESIQVHPRLQSPVNLASLRAAGGEMPTSCCFQDRKGKHWSLFCAAPEPPATSLTSAAHPKLDRASTGPMTPGARTAFRTLFSRNNCVFREGHQHPRPRTHRKEEARKAVPPIETEKTDPLCSPCPFSASTEVHDPPLLPTGTRKLQNISPFPSLHLL